MKPTFSSKLRRETRGYHSSVAVVLFVIFVTVTISLFFLAIKGVFTSKKKEEQKPSETATQELEEAKVEPQVQEETKYTVKSGDTLYSIGIKFGIDWKKIAEVNNLDEPYTLSTGQELKIPKNGNNK